MTRLKESDIDRIIYQMDQYNQELLNKTGHTLAEIAAHAVGIKGVDEAKLRGLGPIAVIPMTCGQGVIGGFSETVTGILAFLGTKAFVTNSSDAKGFAEALERKAVIIFMADDERFIAANLKTGQCSDNSAATGKGYVAALDYMTGGLKDQSVLILGAGPVGTAAVFSVLDFGGKVHVYDKNSNASEKLANAVLDRQDFHVERELDTALKGHRVIVDACPEAEFITPDHLYSDSYVAAPGVPLGIHSEALAQIQNRLIHDPLQLGVATMLYEIMDDIVKED
ncbi:3-methylornithyl-N6-L-lysine dehydrogenase PylD [Sporomusa malonica]|uniref:Pyrrolysine biosynthesis protein PylD n=1 Tax=Sporomusa malonica TaxID=112901 RepID=A0A1W1YJ27_9FIRM|nr:3-methylornithyl-N6-L-lysine dehydrogenase PylD [Sporomusa malonica]SMC35748.1 pyrrolysine biosynthesis protein PylD [Sporomusa malonica]